MNELAFKFYSIIKNEDVPPYLGEGFLVCADGLGGSGSVVHEIDREKHPDLKNELFEAAFGDIGKDELAFCADYVDSLLSEMADEKSDTSAMWGSRIATVRFIYVMTKKPEGMADVSSESDRAAIAKFIHKGLLSVKNHFDLSVGSITGMLPLPTTLCSVKYEDKGDYVLAESIWAGDSRCYYITADGLKCASIDDEGSNGGITNLFDALDETVTTLNYKKFEIKKPCVLLTASDGIFDTFKPSVNHSFEPENFGVEQEILSHVMKASSPEEASVLLHDCYNKDHRGDDSTLCFVPIGFDSYEDVKKVLKPRADKICALWDEFKTRESQLFSLSVDENSLASYVKQRTRDKFSTIVAKIAELYSTDTPDPVFTKELSEFFAEKKAELAKSLLGRRAGALEANITKFEAELLNEPSIAVLPKKGTKDKVCVFNPLGGKCITDASVRAADLVDKKAELEKRVDAYENELGALKKLKEELRISCKELSESLIDEDGDMGAAWSKNMEIFASLSACLRSIYKTDDNIEKPVIVKGAPAKYSQLISASARIIDKVNGANGKLKYAKTQYSMALRSYKSAIGAIMLQIKSSFSAVDTLLTERAVKSYHLSSKISDEELNEAFKSEISSVLSSPASTEKLVEIITNALKGALDGASAIEQSYNEARLKRFKEYYKAMTMPREEIEALEGKIKATINAYDCDLA